MKTMRAPIAKLEQGLSARAEVARCGLNVDTIGRYQRFVIGLFAGHHCFQAISNRAARVRVITQPIIDRLNA
jgi:hypothetical protein